MKKIGIWIDKEKAYILSMDNNTEAFTTVQSNLENYRPVGGARSKTRWGPQDVIQDRKFLERRKHQLKNYFAEIAKTIIDADAIAIYGPADTNFKLKQELSENYKRLAEKIKIVEKADSMTINQTKALLRNFFST
jgi:Txe/YoeB family toxin of Txe-Axe toxin-antitoxin module